MKNGFTLVELIIGIIIMSLVLAGLFTTFSSSQRNAAEMVANQQINDEFERTLLKITEDVREANEILPGSPPVLSQADLADFKTSSPENQLKFTKYTFDFTKDPINLPDGTFNYTKTEIIYYLVKENNIDADSPWVLVREMIPYNNRMEKLVSEIRSYPVLKGISKCLFYRLEEPDASRSGNLYIRLKMMRLDKKGPDHQKYSNETVIAVKERGAIPQ
jgi:prepilin-type N-terminal cleavage/methylation domain-containing protein